MPLPYSQTAGGEGERKRGNTKGLLWKCGVFGYKAKEMKAAPFSKDRACVHWGLRSESSPLFEPGRVLLNPGIVQCFTPAHTHTHAREGAGFC